MDINELIDEWLEAPITWREMVIRGYHAGLAAAQEWTPASTPPEKAGAYLTTARWIGQDGKPEYRVREEHWQQNWDGVWMWSCGFVIAWRPLPPPYEPEEER